jgi:hypothetical protein
MVRIPQCESRRDRLVRLRRRAAQRREPRVLWVAMDDTYPHPYLVASLRQTGAAVRELHSAMSRNGQRSFAQYVEFDDRTGYEHPMSIKLVSPRMLLELARAPEDVLVIYELGLVGLYAGLSKPFRPHKVVSLVEADYRHLGRAGTAPLKVMVRRRVARFVDVFVANNPPAREYLVRTLDVPEDKIIVGWWLAGMPADLQARPPTAAPVPQGAPLFVCAGRLIPQKGIDLVIRALPVYRRQYGPCALWIIGDGPERESLVWLGDQLGVEDMVTFLRIGRIWLAMTIPMMMLVCLRWLAVFAGINLGVPVEKYGADAAIRVIDGPFTFFLAHAFVLTIPAWLRGEQERWIRWVSVLLLLFVLVLNRRTVWLAIVVGVAIVMLRDRRLGRRALLFVALGAVMTVVAFVWLGGLQEGSEPLVESGSGNLAWRVQGWEALVEAWSHGWTDWAVGQPVGSGFVRQVEGLETNVHPHNFYIEIMIRTGLVGLLALLALTVGLLRALWRAPARDADSSDRGSYPPCWPCRSSGS